MFVQTFYIHIFIFCRTRSRHEVEHEYNKTCLKSSRTSPSRRRRKNNIWVMEFILSHLFEQKANLEIERTNVFGVYCKSNEEGKFIKKHLKEEILQTYRKQTLQWLQVKCRGCCLFHKLVIRIVNFSISIRTTLEVRGFRLAAAKSCIISDTQHRVSYVF